MYNLAYWGRGGQRRKKVSCHSYLTLYTSATPNGTSTFELIFPNAVVSVTGAFA